ncbi:MAG: prephenate dehydratase [Pseudomonadales bacterium]
MPNDDELKKLREAIDRIDVQLQDLISQRAQCAQQVAKVKLQERVEAASDSDANVTFYRPEREAQVLGRVIERNKGPLADNRVAHIFREIMSACLALEKPTQVAFFGPKGTYTHEATLKHFGHSAIAQPHSSIAEVFAQVESEQAHYGVVPVENSTEGMVSHTLDNFINSPLKICGEVELRIRLQLLFNAKAKAEDIRQICGHQQALAQSRGWLTKNWPHVEQNAVSSNGEAARLATSDVHTAAIASAMAADLYELQCAAANIEDRADNTTRFLVIGDQIVHPSGSDKTSIIVATRNKPGALFKLLEPFHRDGVMLTRIDTRPSQTETWAYLFFIEFEGHQDDTLIRSILTELEEHSVMIKVLGSYPKAVF